MRLKIFAGIAVAAALAAPGGWAAGGHAPKKIMAKPAAGKSGPSCAALVFHALPGGFSEGEQTAGQYKSRFARLELRATVQGGAPVNYYAVANGNRLAAAPKSPPEAAVACAASKQMPKPQAAADTCTGERFTLVLVHIGQQRYGLLYAQNGGGWRYCGAGTF